MKYAVRGKKSVSLTGNNFIFQGGEGKVYGKGKLAYKIYDDPKKMIPEAKIGELGAISHANVVKPLDVVLDGNNTPVGFTMQRVENCVPAAKLFTNDFRNMNGISDSTVSDLVEAMREIVLSVHRADCLIVDGNEFNYLVDGKSFAEPFLIDVDSCQTPSFPATAIMPSIRDPLAKKFSDLTDWYSFAILACQLFVGIHPFKGRHPDYNRKKLGKNLLQKRMADNISIFNPKVTVPPSTRDFGRIPGNYTDWFFEIFEKGKRIPPPGTAGAFKAVAVKVTTVRGTDSFEIRLLRKFDSDITHHNVVFGVEVTKTGNGVVIGRSEHRCPADTEVVFTPKKAKPVLVNIKNGMLRFSPTGRNEKIAAVSVECSEKMVFENTVFARNSGNLIEMSLMDGPKGDIIASVQATWNIMPNSSEMYDGVIFQSVLGEPYLFLPMPRNGGKGSCVNLHVPELRGCRVVDAKHENRVCVIIAHKDDSYRRLTLKFDENHTSYNCSVEKDIENRTANFTVLDNGVTVAVNEDKFIDVFLNRKGDTRIDRIEEPDMYSSMKMCRDGIVAKFFKGKSLYSIRKKNV